MRKLFLALTVVSSLILASCGNKQTGSDVEIDPDNLIAPIVRYDGTHEDVVVTDVIVDTVERYHVNCETNDTTRFKRAINRVNKHKKQVKVEGPVVSTKDFFNSVEQQNPGVKISATKAGQKPVAASNNGSNDDSKESVTTPVSDDSGNTDDEEESSSNFGWIGDWFKGIGGTAALIAFAALCIALLIALILCLRNWLNGIPRNERAVTENRGGGSPVVSANDVQNLNLDRRTSGKGAPLPGVKKTTITEKTERTTVHEY